MIDLTPIINAAILLVALLISAFFIPWLKSKTTAEQRENLLRWAEIAVAAAQQLFHDRDGAARLEYAMSLLEEKGFDITEGAVRDAVEAMVLKLHQQLGGDTNDS